MVDAATGEKTAMELSGSNVLRYELSDGTSVIVRPSAFWNTFRCGTCWSAGPPGTCPGSIR